MGQGEHHRRAPRHGGDYRGDGGHDRDDGADDAHARGETGAAAAQLGAGAGKAAIDAVGAVSGQAAERHAAFSPGDGMLVGPS